MTLEDVDPVKEITIQVVDEAMTPLAPPRTLRPPEEGSVLINQVVDAELHEHLFKIIDEKGDPVEDARVVLVSPFRATGGMGSLIVPGRRSDKNGICRFIGLKASRASVTVVKFGSRELYLGDVSVQGDAVTECKLTLSRQD